MITILCAAAATSALLAIAAEWNEKRHRSFYLLKPLTTLLITGIALCAEPGEYRTLVVVGLLLSLAGDISLMFKGNAWFIGGLSSFLLAHIVFVAAFVHELPTLDIPLWTAIFAVYGLVFFGWLLPKTGPLLGPVIVYGVVLMGMAVAASARWTALHDERSLLLLIGALLFVLSDSSLAVRQFNGMYRHAQALILSTYWSSIGLIALSTTV